MTDRVSSNPATDSGNADPAPTFRMPAEWEPQQATWTAWPCNAETWPQNLSKAQNEFTDFVIAIARDQPVYVCGDNAGHHQFRNCLAARNESENENIRLPLIPTNDAWIRDYGPTFVRTVDSEILPTDLHRPEIADLPPALESHSSVESKGVVESQPKGSGKPICSLATVDWQYNAWGGKYPPFNHDQAVVSKIAQQMALPRFESPFIVEGGGLEINQSGVLLVTESCLLDVNRNNAKNIPALLGMDKDSANEVYRTTLRAQLNREFQRLLGARQVIWLPGDAIDDRGDFVSTLTGDDTDGHVDQLVRFVNNTTIAHAWTNDHDDPQHSAIQSNVECLNQLTNEQGLQFDLIRLPLPQNPVMFGDLRIPASYCNFLITNRSVIVPQFGDVNDHRALEILKPLFPNRNVIGLRSNHLSVGLGSFHCLSQQMPAR